MRKLRTPAGIVVGLALAGVFFAYGLVPAWRSLNTDFVNYYIAARLFRQGDSLAKVYDWIWFQRQKDHAGIEKRIVTFYPLTLPSAMPILPLTTFSPLSAKRYWLGINLLLLGLSGYLLHRMTALSRGQTAILVLLAVQPLQRHFLFGQFHIPVLCLLVVSLWLYLKGRPIGSGVMLAVASAIKIYPILFVFYFIRKKQWRVVAGLAGGAVLLTALAVYLFGLEVNRVYLQQVLPRTLNGDIVDPYNPHLRSFTGLFRRLFVFEPEMNPDPYMDLPFAYAMLQALTQGLLFFPLLWLLTPRRAEADKEKLEYATYVMALLLLATGGGPYQYIVMILCAILVSDFLLRERRISELVLVVLFYTLACLPDSIVLPPLSQPFFTTAFFLLLLKILTSRASKTWWERLQSRGALVFVPMFVCAVGFGVFNNLRHIRASSQDYSARIPTGTKSLMKAHPAASEGRVAFTMLQSPQYTIGVFSGNRLSTVATDVDAFHPAFIPGSSEMLVELAGPLSNIVRVDLDVARASFGSSPVEVENGQQPVVSPNGRWLAFIREVHGRGGLWIKSLPLNGAPPATLTDERELVSPEHDVLEAAFDAASGAIVFSGQPTQLGRQALFKVDLTSSRITQVMFESPVRYPALSRDGDWLAYSKQERGNWQIWLKPLRSGTERQVTAGDCNSISPAWTPDSKELLYATDCGRGLGMTTLARTRIAP